MVSGRSSVSKGYKTVVFLLGKFVGIECYQGQLLDAAVAEALKVYVAS